MREALRRHGRTFARAFWLHFARGLGQGVGFAGTIMLVVAVLIALKHAGFIGNG